MKINFKVLEVLRGLTALYVVINHCRGMLIIGGNELSETLPFEQWSILKKVYYGLLQLTSLGPEAVIIFFVLSGFSIAHSLKHNTKTLVFYKKRLIRLYFPYIVALIYAALIFTVIQSTINLNLPSVFDSPKAVIKNVFYISNGALIPQFWSLSLEVIFYILAPVILFSKRTIKVYYVISLFLLFFSLTLSSTNQGYTFLLTKFLLDYNIYFAFGIFAYNNVKLYDTYRFLFNSRSIMISTIVFVPLLILLNHKFGYFNKLTFFVSAIYSLTLLGFFLTNAIETRFFQFIGKISYTLYVTHFATVMFALYFFDKFNLVDGNVSITNPFLWMTAVPLCVIVAIPLYYIGEYPTIKILNRIRRNSK